MEMHTSSNESSNLQAEAKNNSVTNAENRSASEGLERISQALWKVINAQVKENDASLWKMWR